MNDVEKFVLAAGAKDEARAKDCLQKAMKKKVAEKLVAVLASVRAEKSESK